MSIKLDQINLIVSCEKGFLEFAPIVLGSYRKFFPEFRLILVYVGTERIDLSYDQIIYFKPNDTISLANQGKFARHYVAANLPLETICMIEDIDTIPLQRDYIERIVSQMRDDSLNIVGAEVYSNDPILYGKFPISHLTAKTQIFKTIFKSDLTFRDYIPNIRYQIFDHKESINSFEFSDESLYRAALSTVSGLKLNYIVRDCDPRRDWIDRSWWHVDPIKLYSGGYVTCNFKRPLPNDKSTREIFNYIFT